MTAGSNTSTGHFMRIIKAVVEKITSLIIVFEDREYFLGILFLLPANRAPFL
jgi:hypothetical protein